MPSSSRKGPGDSGSAAAALVPAPHLEVLLDEVRRYVVGQHQHRAGLVEVVHLGQRAGLEGPGRACRWSPPPNRRAGLPGAHPARIGAGAPGAEPRRRPIRRRVAAG